MSAHSSGDRTAMPVRIPVTDDREGNVVLRNGEGGIRTLGSLLDYDALAKRCFRPLSHLTNEVARIWGGADDRQHVPPALVFSA